MLIWVFLNQIQFNRFMNLGELRKKIDTLDSEIVDHLNERVKLAIEIGRIKEKAGKDVYDPSREVEILIKLDSKNKGPLDNAAIRSVYREIISASIALEKPITVAYLGPEATFTHQAALKNFGTSLNYIPLNSFSEVFYSVEKGESQYGVIAVENSTEGAVTHSLDLLVETDLKIISEIYLEVSMCLISQSPLGDIKAIHSKDIAIAQCRQWLSRQLPGVEEINTPSTADAVRYVKEHPGTAAIAGAAAANIYKVAVIEENIQDKTDNVTRFLVIGNAPSSRLGKRRDKTSFVFSLQDKPGALQDALEPFSKRGINMNKIESRPSRQKLWDYYFFVDIIGHYEDAEVQEALEELKVTCPMVKCLGSYPNTKNTE